MSWVFLVLGLFLGVVIGVTVMCLLSMNDMPED